jgi:hypothetical protein
MVVEAAGGVLHGTTDKLHVPASAGDSGELHRLSVGQQTVDGICQAECSGIRQHVALYRRPRGALRFDDGSDDAKLRCWL